MLDSIVFEIWQWCLQRTVSLSAEHIPGALNGIADTESRVDRDSSDWKLDPSVFARLNTLWGPLEVDLFATRLTNQLSRFVSWRPDLEGEATDASTLDWSQIRGYVFPPSSLVGPWLSHLREHNSEMLCLVAPIWETQPWNPVLLHLSVDFPTFLPVGQEILSREGSPPPLPPPPQRAGWLVPANVAHQWGFQAKLKIFSLPDVTRRLVLTSQTGVCDIAGVINNKLIPFLPLYMT